jgi:hypothetical protein
VCHLKVNVQWKNITQLTKVVEAFYTGSIIGASKPVLYTYFFTQGEELEKIQNLLALKILKFKK